MKIIYKKSKMPYNYCLFLAMIEPQKVRHLLWLSCSWILCNVSHVVDKWMKQLGILWVKPTVHPTE